MKSKKSIFLFYFIFTIVARTTSEYFSIKKIFKELLKTQNNFSRNNFVMISQSEQNMEFDFQEYYY